MSTRATLTIEDDHDTFHIYRHHDGYPNTPDGVINHINKAQSLAWELPRFEAADFAAAVLAVMKSRPGSVYMTKNADQHSDRAFHYVLSHTRNQIWVQVLAKMYESDWRARPLERRVFSGPLAKAVAKYCPPDERPMPPRKLRILEQAQQTLRQVQQYLNAPKQDQVPAVISNQAEKSARDLGQLQRFIEQDDPWAALQATKLPPNAHFAKAALAARGRFQG